MLVGLNSKNELVYLVSNAQAKKLLAEKSQFFCPNCQKPLKICCGSQTRPYFRHLFKAVSNNESEIHERGKDLLGIVWQENGFEIEKEKIVITADEERRVDLFVCPSLAIEFQCSPLSVGLLRKRNNFYRRKGWQSLWFLGPAYLKGKCFGKNALKFLQYNQRLGFYLLFLEVETRKIQIYHHIRKYDWNSFDWIQENVSADQLFNFHFGKVHKKLKKVPVVMTKKQLAQNLAYRERQVCKLQSVCYEHGYDLLHLPDELFEPDGFAPIYHSKLAVNLYKFLNLEVPALKSEQFPLL
ncbi:competence protein CoiA [Xylocopilactobacillus apicola]|uniref:Competence protein CoiA n=1 Tax=Xylocopilactobacillus apicola TaxID=2932184 RepID=A0AAU9CYB6_9LACO|nr:competence protein CoiA family protein [Xylocopilactobacillus apicola]BDR59017.1 hypothetical protein XA3_14580 [Xylocopilactobacillus apicola]